MGGGLFSQPLILSSLVNEMEPVVAEIQEIVNRETRAWDTKDVNLLLTVFHPDMVWPWPPDPHTHDPLKWIFPWGRFNAERWGKLWQDLFDTHELVHNDRAIQRIEISKEGDGAFAVVDINTLWRDESGNEDHWLGRTCKFYSKLREGWKMTAQIGVLDYTDVTI
jgi:ketosteroid isomerase-like protein